MDGEGSWVSRCAYGGIEHGSVRPSGMETRQEEWRPISGYDGAYEISSEGRVRSYRLPRKRDRLLPTPSMVADSIGTKGYRFVTLIDSKGRAHTSYLHSMVLSAFVGPRQGGMQCRHLDGNRENNRLDNLSWGTPRENAKDRCRHGTIPVGEHHPCAVLHEIDVIHIRQLVRAGFSQSEVGRMYGNGQSQVWSIINRRNWKCVPDVPGDG